MGNLLGGEGKGVVLRRHGLRFYNNVSHRNNETPRMIKMMMMIMTRTRVGSGMAAPGIPRIRIILLMPGYVTVRPFLARLI